MNEAALQEHVNAHFEEEEIKIYTSDDVVAEPAPERISDLDSQLTVTKSIMPKLKNALSFSSANIEKILIETDIDHYGSGLGDLGWGAGYRNIQMLLSALLQVSSSSISFALLNLEKQNYRTLIFLQDPKYQKSINDTWNPNNLSRESMASILEIQTIIETAWAQGFDPEVKNLLY